MDKSQEILEFIGKTGSLMGAELVKLGVYELGKQPSGRKDSIIAYCKYLKVAVDSNYLLPKDKAISYITNKIKGLNPVADQTENKLNNTIVDRIKVTDWNIKRIFQISDIHLANPTKNKREYKIQEYNNIFDKFVQDLKQNFKQNEDIIVISGDVFDSSVSDLESTRIFGNFLKTLRQITEHVIIIAGNHDIREGVLNNTILNRLQVSVEVTHGKYIHNNTILEYGNTHLLISTLATKETIKVSTKDPAITYIGISHYNLLTTAPEGSASNRFKTPRDFNNYDYVLLGDIHEQQIISKTAPIIAYPGSLMQVNLGEQINNHGYYIWNITKPHTLPTFIEIKNKFAQIKIVARNNAHKIIHEIPDHITHIRAKVFHSNTTPEYLNQIKKELSIRYNIVKFEEVAEIETITDTVDEELLDALVPANIDRKQSFLKHLTLNNVFNYDSLEIDFISLTGIVSIGGKNGSGKSNVLKAITLCVDESCIGKDEIEGKGFRKFNKSKGSIKGIFDISEGRELHITISLTGKSKSTLIEIIKNSERIDGGKGKSDSKQKQSEYLCEYWHELNCINGDSNVLISLPPGKRYIKVTKLLGYDQISTAYVNALNEHKKLNTDLNAIKKQYELHKLEPITNEEELLKEKADLEQKLFNLQKEITRVESIVTQKITQYNLQLPSSVPAIETSIEKLEEIAYEFQNDTIIEELNHRLRIIPYIASTNQPDLFPDIGFTEAEKEEWIKLKDIPRDAKYVSEDHLRNLIKQNKSQEVYKIILDFLDYKIEFGDPTATKRIAELESIAYYTRIDNEKYKAEIINDYKQQLATHCKALLETIAPKQTELKTFQARYNELCHIQFKKQTYETNREQELKILEDKNAITIEIAKLKDFHDNFLTTRMKQISQYAGAIMAHCNVPFKPDLTIKGKELDLHFINIHTHQEVKYGNLSGYQAFISNIALSLAINKYSEFWKFDLFIIDEGFGVVDGDNIKYIPLLFDIIRKQFRTTLLISHVERVNEYADHRFIVKNKNGDAQLIELD